MNKNEITDASPRKSNICSLYEVGCLAEIFNELKLEIGVLEINPSNLFSISTVTKLDNNFDGISLYTSFEIVLLSIIIIIYKLPAIKIITDFIF